MAPLAWNPRPAAALRSSHREEEKPVNGRRLPPCGHLSAWDPHAHPNTQWRHQSCAHARPQDEFPFQKALMGRICMKGDLLPRFHEPMLPSAGGSREAVGEERGSAWLRPRSLPVTVNISEWHSAQVSAGEQTVLPLQARWWRVCTRYRWGPL